MPYSLKARLIGHAKAAGCRLPLYLPRIEMLMQFSKFGSWVRAEAPPAAASFSSREDLYHFVVNTLIGNSAFDFLEFGVWQGASMALWMSASSSPKARFYGFDSFEGLPEKWSHLTFTDSRGQFDVGGEIPRLPDPRVQFVKGWFQDTLPGFLRTFEPQGPLVIHLDADLYSSTLFILTSLAPYLVPGTVLVFDEFSSTSTCEFRAFMDYASAFRCRYRLVAHSGTFYDQVCLQVTS